MDIDDPEERTFSCPLGGSVREVETRGTSMYTHMVAEKTVMRSFKISVLLFEVS